SFRGISRRNVQCVQCRLFHLNAVCPKEQFLAQLNSSPILKMSLIFFLLIKSGIICTLMIFSCTIAFQLTMFKPLEWCSKAALMMSSIGAHHADYNSMVIRLS